MSGGGFSAFSRRVTRGFSMPLVAATSPFRRPLAQKQEEQQKIQQEEKRQEQEKRQEKEKRQEQEKLEEQRTYKQVDAAAKDSAVAGKPNAWWGGVRRDSESGSTQVLPPQRQDASQPPAVAPPPLLAPSQTSTTTSGSQSVESLPKLPKTQRQLQLNWKVNWGSYCRRTPTRENQDAWFCLRPAPYEGHTYFPAAQGEAVGAPVHSLVRHAVVWGAWQSDTTLQSIPREGTLTDCGAAVKIPFGFTSLVPDDSFACPVDQSCSTSRRALIFGVLDGHGTGGRVASHVGGEAIAQTLAKGCQDALNMFHAASQTAPLPSLLIDPEHQPGVGKRELRARLKLLQGNMVRAFKEAQQSILEKNYKDNRDYGTTAVVSALAGRFILTATAGDSSAFIIAATTRGRRAVVNVKLSCDHSLQNDVELERIKRSGTGQVVLGDGGVSRLIPSNIPYETAKNQGLSINMARALGHCTLSRCALSPEPEMTLVDLMDIYSALNSAIHPGSNLQSLEHRNFEAKAFGITIQQKFADVEDVPLTEVASKIALSSAQLLNETRPGFRTPRRNSTIDNGISLLRRSPSRSLEPASAPLIARRSSASVTRRSRIVASPPCSWAGRLKDGNGGTHSWDSPAEVQDDSNSSPYTEGSRKRRTSEALPRVQPLPLSKPSPRPYVADDPFEATLNCETAQKLSRQTEVFLVLLSDGVTDVMQRVDVSEFVLRRHQMGDSAVAIAEALTKNAADIRAGKGYRADNCTAVVARLDPS